MRHVRGKKRFAACLAGLVLAASATPASASVTIGQLDPGTPVSDVCTGTFDLLQPTVTAGNSYVVPATGGVTDWTVTSWSTKVSADPGQSIGLKMFRKVGEPATFMAIGHEGPHPVVAGVNTFPADIQVESGDVLGTHVGPTPTSCAFTTPDTILYLEDGDLADGASAPFQADTPYRLNATAEVTPTSDFTFGKAKRRSNGTATLAVTVPNPGKIKVSGKGVKGSSAGAVVAKKVTDAGTVKLVIRAKGAKKEKLLDNGKVKVKPKITFTPRGGEPNTRSTKVKLKKKS